MCAYILMIDHVLFPSFYTQKQKQLCSFEWLWISPTGFYLIIVAYILKHEIQAYSKF